MSYSLVPKLQLGDECDNGSLQTRNKEERGHGQLHFP